MVNGSMKSYASLTALTNITVIMTLDFVFFRLTAQMIIMLKIIRELVFHNVMVPSLTQF